MSGERGGPPLLVTGMPRTATSWVGKMLEASGRLVYVNEPLNPRHPPGRSPGVLRADVQHAFQYISEDNERDWLPAFRDTAARPPRPAGRPLFGCQVVVTVRDPVATVSDSRGNPRV